MAPWSEKLSVRWLDIAKGLKIGLKCSNGKGGNENYAADSFGIPERQMPPTIAVSAPNTASNRHNKGHLPAVSGITAVNDPLVLKDYGAASAAQSLEAWAHCCGSPISVERSLIEIASFPPG